MKRRLQFLVATLLLAGIGFRAKDRSSGLSSDFFLYGQTSSTTSTVTDSRSTNHIFAQVVDGRLDDGSSYRSTLIVQSDASVTVTCTATLFSLTIPGFGDGANLSISLPAGGIAIVDTPGTQTIETGYMTLTCSSAVTAQVLYSSRSTSGTVLSEATVFSSPAVTTAQLFADQRDGSQLGIAVANNSNTSKNLLVVASDISGTEVSRTTVTVGSKSQFAKFLSELMTVPDSFLGTVRISESGGDNADIYAIGLKYTGNAFTTIPVTSRTSAINSSSPPASTDNRSTNHIFAQIPDGRFGDGFSYRSTLVVQSDTSGAVTCRATLGGLTIPGFGDGQSLSINLAAGAIAVVDTPGTQPIKTGYMTLTCSSAVTAQVLYLLRSSSGTVISEATVFSSPPVTTAQLFADQRNGSQLGIAIANNSNSKSLLITATDINGMEVGRATVGLSGKSQIAKFLSDFVTVPANFVGTVHISESGGYTADIYAIGLKYTGNAFTTIPVTSRSSPPTLTSIGPGTIPGTAGVSFNISFMGTNFVAGQTTVSISGSVSVSAIRVISSTSLTATLTINGTAGTVIISSPIVTVTTPGGTSNGITLNIVPPVPTLTSILPTFGAAGSSVNVAILGTNFVSGMTVSAGTGVTASNVAVSTSTTATATFIISSTAVGGSHDVTVTTSVGTSNAVTFTVVPTAATPTLTAIVPNSVHAGSSVNVTITGTNFVSGMTVSAGSDITVANLYINSPTTATAIFIVTSPTIVGSRNVIVTTPGGTSNAIPFNIVPPSPTLTAIVPNSGNPASAVNVTITGTNFVSGMSVSAGPQITVGNVSVSGSTTATATFTIDSTAIAGPRNVTVTTSGGTTNAQTFTVKAIEPAPTSIISTVAGSNMIPGFGGDGGPATSAQLNQPLAVAVDAAGNLFIADSYNDRIRKVTAAGVISTVTTTLFLPTSVAVDITGNVFFADPLHYRISKVTPSGVINTVAGNGTIGFSGDGGSATSAQLNGPTGVSIDTAGNLYIADTYNHRIRKVTSDGVISTAAGNGTDGFGGDGGAATSAQLSAPQAVAADAGGNLFIATGGVIRKVTPAGVINTIAGKVITQGSSTGDCGPATSATLKGPHAVAVDAAGNVFISDAHDDRIRKVTADGVISTVAGTGVSGFSGDGGPATSARLSSPNGIAVDTAGNLFIADSFNNRIRKVTAPLTSTCSP